MVGENFGLIEHDTRGVRALVGRIRSRSRARRAAMLHRHFKLGASDRVLDLGGWDGSHIHSVLRGSAVQANNVYVADVDEAAVRLAEQRHGYRPLLLQEGEPLPFSDGFFDLVFCSSVLEHVTVPKSEIWQERSGRRFAQRARLAQQAFAREIVRVGRGHFVQVPCWAFPIETHSWLPFFSYLPRPVQLPLMALANRVWIKKTQPDFYLPTAAEMRSYFPSSELLIERSLGLPKSLIALRAGL